MLDGSGISATLREMGVKEGDDVIIGKLEFAWRDDQSEAALYGVSMFLCCYSLMSGNEDSTTLACPVQLHCQLKSILSCALIGLPDF